MEHIMLEHGYEVTLAESAASATALISSQRFDLVICDVSLPGGNGLNRSRHGNPPPGRHG
jgi:two-component system, OmpR family, response regulator